jgi:hypothetical protein
MKRLQLLLFLILMIFGGCKYACLENYMNPVFIGFGPGQVDTFVVRAYQPNSNFQQLVDTTVVTNCCAGVFTVQGDSTVIFLNEESNSKNLSPDYDWQIYIPSTGKTARITSIQSPLSKGTRGCYNPIISYVQDGQFVNAKLVETGKFYTSGYLIYITNP